MSITTAISAQSFVLLPLGSRQIALSADSVIELVALGKLQSFPHATPWISGVLVRRNRIVPVCDVSKLFGEESGSATRFYLIAEWQEPGVRDWCAIPVCGECKLASAEMEESARGNPAPAEHKPFVKGVIMVEDERIVVVDLAKAVRSSENTSENRGPESAQ